MNRRTMLTILKLKGLWLSVLVFILVLSACSRQISGNQVITMAAMPPGTSWYVFAATLSQLLAQELGEGYRVEVIPRGGGVGNPIVVNRGDATIGLSQAVMAAWAVQGKGPYHDRQCTRLRALVGGLNRVWLTPILTRSYIERTGHATLKDALLSSTPPRIVIKPEGSTVPYFADVVFETYGLTREEYVRRGGQVIQVAANQIPTLLREGRADLYLETSVRGHPTVTDVATTVDVEFLDLPPEVIERLRGPGATVIPMPVMFPKQKKPVQSIDMGTVLITRDDLPEDLAYLIAKVLCENRETMAAAHKAWEHFEPEKAWMLERTGIPLHPGAARYFIERGWMPQNPSQQLTNGK